MRNWLRNYCERRIRDTTADVNIHLIVASIAVYLVNWLGSTLDLWTVVDI